jgi:periplasmic protein TonB
MHMNLGLMLITLLLLSANQSISQVNKTDKSATKSSTEKPLQFQVIEVENSPEGTPDHPSIAAPVEAMEAVEEAPSDPVFTIVEKMPEFKGGTEALKKFIQDHLVYPKEAIEANVQGNTYVKFVVRADGQLTNFEVLRSMHPSMKIAALDVVKLTAGDWTPGEQNGKKVDVYYTLPVRFVLKD